MEISHLRYFVVLSRCCNYSRAAEELFITQPTLSQQIKRLEEELGVRLFERSTRRVVLTQAGQECLIWAERALAALDSLEQTARQESRNDRLRIRLGVLKIYPYTNISDVLGSFRQAYPEIDLQMSFANSVDLMDMLLRGKMDTVITNLSPDTLEKETLDSLLLDIFWDDRLHVVLSEKNPLSSRRALSIEDILNEPMLFNDMRSSPRMRFHMAVRSRGYALPEGSECPSMSSMFNFIRADMGISVMTAHIARAYLQPGMACIPIEPSLLTQTALVRKKSVRFPALQTFAEYFSEHIERMSM